MKVNSIKIIVGAIALWGVLSLPLYAEDVEKPKISLTLVPMEYISVKGDVQKFRAQTWKNDGYSSGIEDILLTGKMSKDTAFSYEGHAYTNTNDYGGNLELTKENFGFFKVDYDMFRKYYDGTGGMYYPFTTLSGKTPDQDFKMDIGHMGFEVGETFGNLPQISLFYDQNTKNGVKSRLSWVGATQGSVTKLIAPSWQSVNETINSYGLRSQGELGGFNLKGEQKWESLNATTMREEKSISTNTSGATASERKIRRQYQDSDSDSSVSTLHGEKWFWQDTGMLALAYRYNKIDTSEGENLREYDENGNPRSFSNPKNKFNASADNEYTSNIVTGNFQSQPAKSLLFNLKLKTELIDRSGNSTYPSETDNPPDNIINTTEISRVDNTVQNWGGNLGLRYSGFKKTSMYGDVEIGRINNWLYENRNSIAGQTAAVPGEVFFRDSNIYTNKIVLTTGTRTVLSKYLNFTTQVRRRTENNDYDDKAESLPTGGVDDKSAFFDFLQLKGTEVATKWTVKPIKKVTGSMRYQYADTVYVARVDKSYNQRSWTTSHTFTYDVILEPLSTLLLDFGYMRQFAKTSTPAAGGAAPRIPGFTSNINTWTMSGSYLMNEKMTLISAFSKADQDNFDDFTATGLPYGVDASWYDASVGLKWAATKIVTIEPKYTYYNYQDNPKSEAGGGYSAHEVWLGVNLDWM